MLVNGVWTEKWQPVQAKDQQGRFLRETATFEGRIENPHDLLGGRYTLYVTYICPWASRVLIARSLLGLTQYLPVVIADPVLSDFGWQFSGNMGTSNENEAEVTYIHQLYSRSQPDYTGRATVPVLWDNWRQKIVNNESSDILQILNEDLRTIHRSEIDLRPNTLVSQIDSFNERTYHTLNNGVYRAGFASSDLAYSEAVQEVFETLDWLEEHFQTQKYAVADQLTEADIRLFVTLVRFDLAYYGLFKTNIRRISEYPSLSHYLKRLLKRPEFAANTKPEHIKAGYYSIKALNPSQRVPLGPDLDWLTLLEDS